MKYYIEYPIPLKCNLRCGYCFHQMLWEHNERYPGNRYGDKCPFTFDQYRAWRDKHLGDGTEFLMELHGGEMSHPECGGVVLGIIDAADRERFQLQTNGLGDAAFYSCLINSGDKIDRIGFTYHRKMIADKPNIVDKFIDNVNMLKDAGLNVYVKELLMLEDKAAILRNRRYWESMGVEFRIQDFKGGGESEKYTPEDWALVHPEYLHKGANCSCRAGYKQILIRGYDMMGGDVLACWQDHKRIGSITEDWYEPYTVVAVDGGMPRGRRVVGGRDYRSDHTRDAEIAERERVLYNNKQGRYWMLARLQADKERLQKLLGEAEARMAQRAKLIAQLQAEDAKDGDLVKLAQGGIQITDDHIRWAQEPEAVAAEGGGASIAEPPVVPVAYGGVPESAEPRTRVA